MVVDFDYDPNLCPLLVRRFESKKKEHGEDHLCQVFINDFLAYLVCLPRVNPFGQSVQKATLLLLYKYSALVILEGMDDGKREDGVVLCFWTRVKETNMVDVPKGSIGYDEGTPSKEPVVSFLIPSSRVTVVTLVNKRG